jgi:hypothetical protein
MGSKGFTLAELQVVAVAFLIAIIAIAMGARVLGEMAELEQTSSTDTTGVTNESLNFAANYTWYNLGHRPIVGLSSVKNTTDSISTSFFSTRNDVGGNAQIRMINDGTLVAGIYNVSYTYGSERFYNITFKGLEALRTFSDWLPIVAIAVIASVVIGVVIVYFGRYSQRGV